MGPNLGVVVLCSGQLNGAIVLQLILRLCNWVLEVVAVILIVGLWLCTCAAPARDLHIAVIEQLLDYVNDVIHVHAAHGAVDSHTALQCGALQEQNSNVPNFST